jgi:zinc protease
MQPLTLTAQKIPFDRYHLPNGLTVILHEDHRLPLVSVNLWYYVGAKDEPPGRSGFAHLFEHLMFMGTEKVPYPQFDVVMEKFGGSNNASTSRDRTNYFETGPSNLLETFLLLEADRMAALGSSMTQEKLDAQRKVVRNERRQSYETRPYGKAHLKIPGQMYPEAHPYHHPVIGSHTDLEQATVEDVKEFFSDFYYPRNATLVVAGDFDPAEARKLVRKYFGVLSSASRPQRKDVGVPTAHWVPTAQLGGTLRVTIPDSVELPLSIFVWHSPAFYKDGDADMDILASIIGGGKSSRLYRSLVYDKKLAQNISAYQSSGYLGSEFRIQAYARPGVSQEEIEREIDLEIERLKEEKPTPREVQRAKNTIETSFWRTVEDLGERADLLNRYQFYYNNPGAIGKDRSRYEAVTPASVQRWAQEALKPDARLILRVVPDKGVPVE